MTQPEQSRLPVEVARALSADLAEYASRATSPPSDAHEPAAMPPGDTWLEEYDRRISDEDLIAASRSRFVSKHYADAVEAGIKALCEFVRQRTGCAEDGDLLMGKVFAPKQPMLRVTKATSPHYESQQRGHLLLCQGVVAAWRNPRAHSLMNDSADRTLMMLELLDDLFAVTRNATRARRKRSS